jgi:ABC-type multidrug transport system permease subunit
MVLLLHEDLANLLGYRVFPKRFTLTDAVAVIADGLVFVLEIIYPMLGLSGLFTPIDTLPPVGRAIARVLPFTYAVSLLRGVWHNEGWWRHRGNVATLALIFVVCIVITGRVFRWE